MGFAIDREMINTLQKEVIYTKKNDLTWWKSDGGGHGILWQARGETAFHTNQSIGQNVLVPEPDFY